MISTCFLICERGKLHKSGDEGDLFVRNCFDFLLKKERVLILGSELSGKTSLAKTLFVDLHHRGLMPIFLRGLDLDSIEIEKVHGFIDRAFIDAFGPALLEKFRQLESSQRAIIVDDFQKSPLSLLEKDTLAQLFSSFSGRSHSSSVR